MLNGNSPARRLSTGCETFKAQAAKTEVSIALPVGGVFAYSSSKSRSISIETTIASKPNGVSPPLDTIPAEYEDLRDLVDFSVQYRYEAFDELPLDRTDTLCLVMQ